jgi:redox-sensitive bicupin YhaK (pirin superfamily)
VLGAPRWGHGQKRFEESDKLGRLRLVASPDGAEGSIALRQDVRLYASVLAPGQSVSLDLPKDRHAWVQIVRGRVSVNGQELSSGDGLAASNEEWLDLAASDGEKAGFLAFDLA